MGGTRVGIRMLIWLKNFQNIHRLEDQLIASYATSGLSIIIKLKKD